MPRAVLKVLTAVLIAVALALACEGGDLLLPGDVHPADIAIVRGNNQTAVGGQALAEPLVIRVVNTAGLPVSGQSVAFVLAAGQGGTVDPDTTTTDSDGRAGTRWTLDPTVGLQTVEARVVGDADVAVRFNASVASGPTERIELVSGDGQTAPAATTLSDPLVVRASDARGDPVAGLLVAWVPNGGGSVSADAVATGTDGHASVQRTLGPASGTQTTVASAGEVSGSPITFTATATTGSAGKLTIATQPSATAVIGVVFPRQPQIQLRDNLGNPSTQAGIAVTASIATGAGATLTGQLTRPTDASGLASFADLALSAAPGVYTLRFSGTGLAAVVSSLITLGTGQVSAVRSALDAEPEAMAVLTGTSRVSVTVRDEAGNLIGGASVVPASSRSGAQFSPGTATTADDGLAVFNFTATIPGAHVISARANGVGIRQTDTVAVTRVPTSTSISSDLPDPSLALSGVPVTVSVTAPAAASPTGSVSVSDGEVSCTATAPSGTCQLVPRSAGSKLLTASYQGSGTFDPSSGTESHRVDSIPTVTDPLQSDRATARQGDDITFRAKVGPSVTGLTPAPAGSTVTFARNACAGPSTAPLGPPQPLDTSGWASLRTDVLPVGIHIIVACYNGSPSHATSGSQPITQVVGPRF